MPRVPLGVKLLLFLYCMSLRKASSQVEVLWEDHRNDLFINGFGTLYFVLLHRRKQCSYRAGISPGILMSAGGSKLRWCACDPSFVSGTSNIFA